MWHWGGGRRWAGGGTLWDVEFHAETRTRCLVEFHTSTRRSCLVENAIGEWLNWWYYRCYSKNESSLKWLVGTVWQEQYHDDWWFICQYNLSWSQKLRQRQLGKFIICRPGIQFGEDLLQCWWAKIAKLIGASVEWFDHLSGARRCKLRAPIILAIEIGVHSSTSQHEYQPSLLLGYLPSQIHGSMLSINYSSEVTENYSGVC